VRGPDSAAVLDAWGVSAPFEVVGDAALALHPEADRVEGRVVVAPCRTRDELWGGSDDAVFARLGDLVRSLAEKDHEVVMLACHPDDDGPCLQVMRHAGLPGLPYHAGYVDLDAAMSLLASADLVVAERLHAAVLGAAGGTPFVALEYRPKVRDFARSVGFDDRTLRTDDLGGLEEITFATLADRIPAAELLATRVEEYRMRLSRAAAALRHLMDA
jgi:polysaccharide pyruvyl transferase WcaK-like protein